MEKKFAYNINSRAQHNIAHMKVSRSEESKAERPWMEDEQEDK
jgi:hypothetical protein